MSARSYSIGSLEFVVPSGYVRELHGVRLYGDQPRASLLSTAQFKTPLEFLQELSRLARELPAADDRFGSRLQLYSAPEEGEDVPDVGVFPPLYASAHELAPLDFSPKDHPWLRCHQLTLYSWEDAFHVSFAHGVFGLRNETFATAVQALERFVQVLSGVAWKDFGDEASRKTLLDKGQFYWVRPLPHKQVPVDNFVFKAAQGLELKLVASGGAYYVEGRGDGLADVSEQFETYAQGLRALARHLRRPRSPEGDVGATSSGTKCEPLERHGRFLVRHILRENDEHEATALVFQTGEGHRVSLLTQACEKPRVTFQPPGGNLAEYTASSVSEALLALADVLETGEFMASGRPSPA